MTLQIRRAADRGETRFDWLDSRHTFSFGDYYDPDWMEFETLRVINDDRVAPGGGFPRHGHRDMEILTYVMAGALEHKDSIGTGSVIRPGDLQRMSAGRGILHSEFNASKTQGVHLLQIWIHPERRGLDPEYQQITLPPAQAGRARLAASPDGRDGSLTIHQNTQLWIVNVDRNAPARVSLLQGQRAWLHVSAGSLQIGSQTLSEGDGAAVSGQDAIDFKSDSPAEALVFTF